MEPIKTKYKPSQCDGLSKARTALREAEQAEASTSVLLWTDVSNSEVDIFQWTSSVYISDQILGGTEKDRPCH